MAAVILLRPGNGEKVPELTDEELKENCLEIALSYQDVYKSAEKVPVSFPEGAVGLTRSGVDAIEAHLIGAGYAAIDSDDPYPEYLANSDGVRALWERICAGEDGDWSYIRVNEDGGFLYLLFRFREGKGSCCCIDVSWDPDGQPYVSRLEEHEVYDFALTQKDHFYYQIYPSDKHYADYTLIDLTPPDKALCDLALKYILPVGYQGTNLFLCDWTEEDYGELSFNDLFEYLYEMRTGQTLAPEEFPVHSEPFYYQIPSALFEETVLPWFSISTGDLREIAGYRPDGDFYPWKQIFTTSDAVWYPCIEPELTQCIENPDGTLTLVAEICSTDFRDDCFFSHEVTVRPLEDGTFQYIANRVTHQTEYGLPPNSPRLSPEELTG